MKLWDENECETYLNECNFFIKSYYLIQFFGWFLVILVICFGLLWELYLIGIFNFLLNFGKIISK